MQTVVLERLDDSNTLVGRVYVDGRKTSAYIVPSPDNEYVFSPEQLKQLRHAERTDMF